MAHTLLKVVWSVFINLDLALVVLLFVLAIWAARRKDRVRPRTVILCLLPWFSVHLTPLGRWLLLALEQRFPQPPAFPAGLPEDVSGIVLLGGSFVLTDSEDRGETVYNMAAPRLFELLAIARRYPGARIVFTGSPREAPLARRVLAEQGVDPGRVTIEGESLNTLDNARNTFRLAQPAPGDTWALVTSALHMPRATGLFRGAGWHITPYPVNFLTSGRAAWRDWLAAPAGTNDLAWRAAAHEIAGLIYHYVAGESPAIFPGP